MFVPFLVPLSVVLLADVLGLVVLLVAGVLVPLAVLLSVVLFADVLGVVVLLVPVVLVAPVVLSSCLRDGQSHPAGNSWAAFPSPA